MTNVCVLVREPRTLSQTIESAANAGRVAEYSSGIRGCIASHPESIGNETSGKKKYIKPVLRVLVVAGFAKNHYPPME